MGKIIDSSDPAAALRSICLAVVFLAPFPPEFFQSSWFDSLQVFIWILAAVGVFTALSVSDKSRLKALLLSPLHIGLAIFVLSAFVSYLFVAGNPRYPRVAAPQMVPELLRLLSFGYLPFMVFGLIPKRPSDLHLSLITVVVYSLGFSLVNLWFASQEGFLGSSHRMGIHKNHIGDVCAAGGLICQAFLLTQKLRLLPSVGLIGLVSVFLVSCLASNSRACMLTFPVTACVIALFQGSRRSLWSKFLLVGASTSLLVGALALAPAEKQAELAQTEAGSSMAARPYFWSLSWEYLQQFPLTPVGYSRNAVLPGSNREIYNPCNFFLEAWLEVGIWGAIGYTVMLLTALVKSSQLVNTFRDSGQLSFLCSSALALLVLRAIRDGQDTSTIGRTLGIMIPVCVGLTFYFGLGAKRLKDRSSSQQGD
jgi:hypothetical protein